MKATGRARKLPALLILLGGLLGGGVIIAASMPRTLIITPPKILQSAYPAPQSPTKNAAANNLGDALFDALAEKVSAAENLTMDKLEDAANDLAQQALDENALDAELVKFLEPELDVRSIKITDADPEASRRYFENFVLLLRRQFAYTSVDSPKTMTSTDFQKIAERYNEAARELNTLLVPEDVLEIHREELRILAVKRNIFNAFANYEEDPVAAAVAVEALEAINSDLSQLKAVILSYLEAHRIQLAAR